MGHATWLIANQDETAGATQAEILRQGGHEVDVVVVGDAALERVRERAYDLLLIDAALPPSGAVETLRTAKRIRPSMPVVVCSSVPDVDLVLRAFRAGAFDFLEIPIESTRLAELAERSVQIRDMGESRRRMAEELEHERLRVVQLRRQLSLDDPFYKLVGRSGPLTDFVNTIREVARTDSTVLLTGESGTGKSLVARTIHEASSRAKGPFVEANCVVYSEGVLQSELFGHERGAFTGAAKLKRGRFELARGGTLFLDEIGEIPPSTQLMLLRVLHDRTFERVGGEETLETDVRLIAATNRDLQAAIREGAFRSDLYYRLNVIPVHLPPLRDRPDDVPLLAEHFLQRCATRLEREAPLLSPEALDALARYAWPGNIRELENVVERIVVLDRTGRVELRDLPVPVRQGLDELLLRTQPGTLRDLERVRIVDALDDAGGNKKLAASKLGIHRSTLYAKLKRYGLLATDEGDERREERQALSSIENGRRGA